MKKMACIFLLLCSLITLSACKDVMTVESAIIDFKKIKSYELSLSDYSNGTIEYLDVVRDDDLYQFGTFEKELALQDTRNPYDVYVYEAFYDVYFIRTFFANLITPYEQILNHYINHVNISWFNREGETLSINEDRRFAIASNSPYKNATIGTIKLDDHVLSIYLKYASGREIKITIKLDMKTKLTIPEDFYEIKYQDKLQYFIKDYKAHIIGTYRSNPEHILTIPQMLGERLVTSIGSRAFQGFSGSSIVFAEDSYVESIGPYAFRDLTLTTDLYLPQTVKTIHEKAFFNATIPHIYFGNSVEMIEKEAFAFATIQKLFFPEAIDTSVFDEGWNQEEIPFQIGQIKEE